ncbi:MAG: class C sortase [Clostridiales Family XIII bacterium]|jgi:sortase A|nr:class C sortase [Clostridiales Family XIII bacterium]
MGRDGGARALPGGAGRGFLRRHALTLTLLGVFFAGLSVLLYPFVSDYVNSRHQSRVIAGYSESVVRMDDASYAGMLDAARAYNEALRANPSRYILSEEERAEYESLLRVSGTGAMGYLEIPSIRVRLPIYHGTGEEVLQAGIGHMEGTSLPVGGPGTHTAITGHRGLPSSLLLTDLDKMSIGDLFMITTLDEVLSYEADQILIVEPDELESLAIVEGMDYATLVTCTPYGINSHRLLVRGHRVEGAGGGARVTADAIMIEPAFSAAIFAAPMLLALLIGALIRYRRRRGGI